MGIFLCENTSNSDTNNIKKPKVFLGGTCNNSTWRDVIIEKLDNIGIDYFNPVVDNWDEKARLNEIIQKSKCDINLYVITNEMTGVYSIAEVIDDSNKIPEKTILCILFKGFDKNQIHSLQSVGKMAEKNGATYVNSLDNVIESILDKFKL